MNNRNDSRRFLLLLWAALTALAGAGCGDVGTEPQPERPRQRASRPLPPATPGVLAPPPQRQAGTDPLTAPDGLAPDGNAKDPLSETGGPSDTGDALASAGGPPMPTEHSHWLRGSIFHARVGVRLNGVYLGEFSAPIDKDITMKLRAGVNTVTFAYRPLAPGAAARLELLESEHTPPIPPLATFRSPESARATDSRTDQATTQTATFLAH